MSVLDPVAVIRARVVQIVVSNADAAVHLALSGRASGMAHDWTAAGAANATFMVPMTPAQALALQPDEELELIVRRAAQ